jgi:copper chaperone CopZ
MKKILFLLVCGLFLSFNLAMAQGKGKKVGNQTVEIKTSAQCEMCDERITKALTAQKGVKSVKVNLDTQIAAVTFNSNQITADQIRAGINKAGYDADDKKAEKEAYKKLPACCKKN